MADQIQKIILKYEADIKDLKKGQDDLLAQMKGVEKQSKSTEKSLTSGFKKAGTAVAGFLAAAKLGDIITDLSNIASQAEGIEAAFNAAFEPGTLQILRKETKGTISDLELMRRALKAREFNIPRDLLAKGFEFARVQANRLGEDVNFLTDSIIDGLGRKSPLILDNLGISQSQLSEEVKKTGDFYTAVGNIIESKLGKNGGAGDIESLADQQARLNADIANLKLEIAQGLTPAFKGVLEVVNDLVQGFARIRQFGLGVSKEEVDELTKSAEDFANVAIEAQLQGIADGLLTEEEAIANVNEQIEIFRAQIKELEESDLSKGEKALNAFLFGLAASDRIEGNNDEIARLTLLIQELQVGLISLKTVVKDDPIFPDAPKDLVLTLQELAELDLSKISSNEILLRRIEEGFRSLAEQAQEARKELSLFLKQSDEAFAADQDEDVPDPFNTAAFLAELEDKTQAQKDAMDELAKAAEDSGFRVATGLGDIATAVFSVIEEGGKKAFLLSQGIAIAEVIFQLQKEIAAISFNLQAAGGPANLVAAALAAKATSAAIARSSGSIAIIGAQTIPQFAKGTEDAPEGWAWVGEKGPELMAIPGGSAILTNRASTNAANRALISSMNRGKTEEHIRDFYIKPALKKERKQEAYDDFYLRQAIKSNKTINLSKSTVRELGKYLQQSRSYF